MSDPCVSVLTPVYNGEPFLGECIESVLAQDYRRLEYTIVNNCSRDRTLEIAEAYARKDSRIQVRTNTAFVTAIENHNTAFRLVPRHCKYCKVVSADDWIDPSCVRKMVQFAEAHPTVGIVGCYQQSGETVRWRGVPPSVSVLSGRDAARLGLMEGVHVLGTPTSVLYRSDILRMTPAFFPHLRSHADTSACYEAFRRCDFGFLHEVLAVERVHPGQWSTAMDVLDAGSISYLEILLQYGPLYLSASEFAARKERVFDAYYRSLGGDVLKLRGRDFWAFHQLRLREMGCEMEWACIAKGTLKEVVDEAKHPVTALRKIVRVLKGRHKRIG